MTPTLVTPNAAQETASRPNPSVIPAVAEAQMKVKQDLRMGRAHQQGRVNWITTIAMGAFHVGAIAALFFFSWTNLATFFVMYFLAINVGIGVAYHRLLTHRGYRTPKWVEYFVTVLAASRLRVDRSSGSPPTAFIIRTPTMKAIHTPRMTVPGGPMLAGFSPAVRSTRRLLFWAVTLLTLPAIQSTSGSASITTCRL